MDELIKQLTTYARGIWQRRWIGFAFAPPLEMGHARFRGAFDQVPQAPAINVHIFVSVRLREKINGANLKELKNLG